MSSYPIPFYAGMQRVVPADQFILGNAQQYSDIKFLNIFR